MKDERNVSSVIEKGGYNKPLIITGIIFVIVAIIGIALVIAYKKKSELCNKRAKYLEENGYVLEKDRELYYECRGSKYCYRKDNVLVRLNISDDDIEIISYYKDKFDAKNDLELIGNLTENTKITKISEDYSKLLNTYSSSEEIDLYLRFYKHSMGVNCETVNHYISEGFDDYNYKLKYDVYYNGGENDGLLIGGVNVTYVDSMEEEPIIKNATTLAFDYNDTGLEFFKDYLINKIKDFDNNSLSHDINIGTDHYTNYCTYELTSYNKEKKQLHCSTLKRIGSINNDYSNYLFTDYKKEELEDLDKYIDNDINYLKEKLVIESVDVESIKKGIKDYLDEKKFDDNLTLKYDKFDVVFSKKYDNDFEIKYCIKVEDDEQIKD